MTAERPWLALVPVAAVVQIVVGVVARPTGPGTGVVAVLRLVLATSTALTLVLGPGLAARAALAERGRSFPFVLVPIPGPALLAAIAGLAWWGAPRVSPHLVVAALSTPLVIAVLVVSSRPARPVADGAWATKALLIVVVVLAIAVAKGTWSPGPAGELYGGTVSRTLEVGGRSDSRISFHVVQLVAFGTGPYGDRGRAYFAPYSFSHRGPLAGMAASSVVLLSGSRVPVEMPDQPWSPVDPQGFAVYRLTMSTMAIGSLLILFALVSRLFGPQIGYRAILVAALTPFLVHETYFTWPKLQAAGLVLVAAYLVLEGRPGWAGLAMGAGYLIHPMVLLSLPALAVLWPLVQRQGVDRNGGRRLAKVRVLVGLAAMGVGALVCLLLWRVVNGGNFAQGSFVADNLLRTDAGPVSGAWSWLAGRLSSVLNTLVPLHLVVRDADHPAVNSIFGPSSGVVHFYFQYWTGLPFGFGITALPVLVASLARTARRAPAVFATVIVLPFVIFATFWGGDATGLLREGMHVWVLTIVVAVVWTLARRRAPSRALARREAGCLAFRAIEVFLMLTVPAAVGSGALVQRQFLATDIVALAVMVAGLSWLAYESFVRLSDLGDGDVNAGRAAALAT